MTVPEKYSTSINAIHKFFFSHDIKSDLAQYKNQPSKTTTELNERQGRTTMSRQVRMNERKTTTKRKQQEHEDPIDTSREGPKLTG